MHTFLPGTEHILQAVGGKNESNNFRRKREGISSQEKITQDMLVVNHIDLYILVLLRRFVLLQKLTFNRMQYVRRLNLLRQT